MAKQNNLVTRNWEFLRMVGIGLGLQWIFSFVGFLGLLTLESLPWPWWEGIIALLFGLILALLILLVGFCTRRAWYIHAMYSLVTLTWAFPLVVSLYRLMPVSILSTSILLTLFSLNMISSYKSTLKRLTSQKDLAANTEKLDLKLERWYLDKPLLIEKKGSGNLAQIIIPIAVILGTMLYRNNPNQIGIISTVINFTIVSLLGMTPGIQIAIIEYLRMVEKEYKKIIRI